MTDEQLAEALRSPVPNRKTHLAPEADARILVVDIERLPGLTSIFDQKTHGFIPVSRWRRLPSLLCFAAKWYDRKAVQFHAAWDDHDAMVQASWDLYDAADIVVGYNSIRFDNKHLKSEWLLAGMPPPRPWKNVDLYAANRNLFGFESKSLNHLCHRLDLDTKSGHYDEIMAEDAINGDLKAQRLMKRYNIGDVKITEQAYDALRPWLAGHPVVNPTAPDGLACNACGSPELVPAGTRQANLMEYPLYRCAGCGGVVSGTRDGVRIARARGAKDA